MLYNMGNGLMNIAETLNNVYGSMKQQYPNWENPKGWAALIPPTYTFVNFLVFAQHSVEILAFVCHSDSK